MQDFRPKATQAGPFELEVVRELLPPDRRVDSRSTRCANKQRASTCVGVGWTRAVRTQDKAGSQQFKLFVPSALRIPLGPSALPCEH